LERWHKPQYFLSERAEIPLRLRDLYMQLQFLNHSGTPLINRIRQQLAHEWPEVAQKNTSRRWMGRVQGLWLAIADEKVSAKWQASLDESQGLGLTPFTRYLAQAIVINEREQIRIEAEAEAILADADVQRYLEVMEQFKFGRRTAIALLSAIYPIERFKGHHNPLGAFKLCCGMAQIWHESGDYTGWIPGGSKEIRTALWNWSLATIPVNAKRQGETTAEIEMLRDYYNNGTVIATEEGELETLDPGIGNQRLMRVCRRALTMLYRQLKAMDKADGLTEEQQVTNL
jgi:hypothetical protein